MQLRLAEAYWLKGDLAEARRRYEMQVRVFPASPNPCVQLARLSKLEHKDEETLAWIKNAVQRGGPPVAQALRQDALFLGRLLQRPGHDLPPMHCTADRVAGGGPPRRSCA